MMVWEASQMNLKLNLRGPVVTFTAPRTLPAFRWCWLARQSVCSPRSPVTNMRSAGVAASPCCWLALQLGGVPRWPVVTICDTSGLASFPLLLACPSAGGVGRALLLPPCKSPQPCAGPWLAAGGYLWVQPGSLWVAFPTGPRSEPRVLTH